MPNTTLIIFTGLCAIALLSCSGPLDERLSDSANQDPTPQPLSASVCTVGNGRVTSLVIKNNNDFAWGEVNISLSKSGINYDATFEDLLPDAVKPSIPLTNSYQFYVDDSAGSEGSKLGRTSSSDPTSFRCHSCPERKPLGNFANLEGALITVSTPIPGQWSGDVTKCEK